LKFKYQSSHLKVNFAKSNNQQSPTLSICALVFNYLMNTVADTSLMKNKLERFSSWYKNAAFYVSLSR